MTLSQYITTWYHTDTECMNILHTPGCNDSFFQSAAWYLSTTHTADQLRSWRTWNWLTQEEPEHTHGSIHTHSVLMSLSGLCSLEYIHKERDVDMQSFYKHKFPAQHKMVWPVRVASFPGSPLGTRLQLGLRIFIKLHSNVGLGYDHVTEQFTHNQDTIPFAKWRLSLNW